MTRSMRAATANGPRTRRPAPGLWAAAGIVALGLAAAPDAGLAQTRIQSGEHVGFSRLALIFPRETDWQARPVEEGYVISFSPAPGPIDLTRVFELIPRSRIEDVQQQPNGSLLIVSDCDCHLDAFAAGDRVLAVDVKDGPDPRAGTAEQGVARPPIQETALPVGLTIRATAVPPASTVLPPLGPGPFPGGTPASPPPDTTTAARAGDDVEAGSATAALDRGIAGASLESRLRTDMRRAAEAGLVDLVEGTGTEPHDTDGSPSPFETRPSPSHEEQEEPLVVAPPESPPAGPERHIDMRTPFDRERPTAGEAPGLLPCPPGGSYAFMAERSAPDILATLPGLRAGIVDAADALEREGARRLVEAYLALGFGAEAAALAESVPMAPEREAMYRSLARILDTGADDAREVWAGLQRCPTSAALWAFLGHTPAVDDPPLDPGALQRAFFALPVHLRLHIGPALAARLGERGMASAAAAIEGNLNVLRNPPAPPTEASGDGGDGATPEGPPLVPGTSDSRVDALIARTLARMQESRLPAADDLALAATLVREHSGTDRGDRLEGLVALGQLADGDIDRATETLTRPDRRESDTWRRALDGATAATITAKSDADLVALAMHPGGPDLLKTLSDAQAVAVANRLTNLGFPGLSLAVLLPVDTARGSPAQHALARATLEAGDPARALALVAGQTAPEAARVRGEALLALGSHALAAAAFASADDPARAALAAWLSGDAETIERFGTVEQREIAASLIPRPTRVREVAEPQTAPEAGSAAFSEADATPDETADGAGTPATASPSATEGPALPAPPPSLAGARALADESTALRDSLRRLLSETGGGA